MAARLIVLLKACRHIIREAHIEPFQLLRMENVDRHFGRASHAQRVVNLEAWGASRARWNFTTKLHPRGNGETID